MRAVRRILVAVKEPKARSVPAVDKGAQLARAFGAQIELYHAISTPLYLGAGGFSDKGLAQVENAQRIQYERRLEAIAGPLRKRGITVTTCSEWDFPAGEAIVRRAARMKADLIVAECHAGEHRGFWPLHLTDWDLLRFSPVPVLLVKNKRPYRHPVVLAAVDPSHAFAKPAALDDEILRAASSLAKAFRGTLHAVHAYVPTPMDATRSELLDPQATKILSARARAHARSRVRPLLKKVKVAPSRVHLVAQHPINAIPELAREIGCAIAVLGAVSRSGLKRIFIGNTAERMLDGLSCDVLVVKPASFVNRVARVKRGPHTVMPALRPPIF
jgi:universal stress protein E